MWSGAAGGAHLSRTGRDTKFADDAKLGGAVDSLEVRETLQRPQQIRGLGNHQLYEEQQGKVPDSAAGMGNPGCSYRLANEMLESSAMERDLGVLVNGKVDMSEQCPGSQEGQLCPGSIRQSIISLSREEERYEPIRECPKEENKMVKGLEGKPYEERAVVISIEAMLMRTQLHWAGHISRMEDHCLPKIVLYGELTTSCCKRGVQKWRYKDCLKQYLSLGHNDCHQWRRSTVPFATGLAYPGSVFLATITLAASVGRALPKSMFVKPGHDDDDDDL
ncbi:hypothetical protein WISP_19479 [Willisornis vidua]|uniref:Uncharacterized protein n=1 Tax=Willisornis vidua TaxID=1566151 RepID=A0ABQ9DPK1_9PASS|nr:hypothetical protein WISP_19479 [Willisornis vidua]